MIVGMNKIKKGPGEHLLDAPSQRSGEGRTQTFKVAIRIGDAEHIQRQFEEEVNIRLGLPASIRLDLELTMDRTDVWEAIRVRR